MNDIKPQEIKAARKRLDYTQQYVADKLGITLYSYRKKESGVVKFTEEQKVSLAKLLHLNFSQMNDYLFDGILPEDNIANEVEKFLFLR